jgi:hypothetical protein
MMITTKAERIEFNPQKNILGLMIERNRGQKKTPHPIMYHLGATID